MALGGRGGRGIARNLTPSPPAPSTQVTPNTSLFTPLSKILPPEPPENHPGCFMCHRRIHPGCSMCHPGCFTSHSRCSMCHGRAASRIHPGCSMCPGRMTLRIHPGCSMCYQRIDPGVSMCQPGLSICHPRDTMFGHVESSPVVPVAATEYEAILAWSSSVERGPVCATAGFVGIS